MSVFLWQINKLTLLLHLLWENPFSLWINFDISRLFFTEIYVWKFRKKIVFQKLLMCIMVNIIVSKFNLRIWHKVEMSQPSEQQF